MYHPSIAYFHYWFRSTNQYGVHSPFVYDLMTKRRKKIPQNEARLLNELRQQLYTNDEFIEINDFGTGSRVFDSNFRQIQKIAKISGISPYWGKKLYTLVNYLQPESILELGTSLGLSTAYMAAAQHQVKLTSIEGCASTHKVARSSLKDWPYGKLNLINDSFDSALNNLKAGQTFDMIYFDGHHAKQPTLNYFERCLSFANESSVFFFDDIYWSKEMKETWQELIERKEVTLSIDCYKWGILFFRKKQDKQHFILRL